MKKTTRIVSMLICIIMLAAYSIIPIAASVNSCPPHNFEIFGTGAYPRGGDSIYCYYNELYYILHCTSCGIYTNQRAPNDDFRIHYFINGVCQYCGYTN